jgi:hypothetical protein
MPPYSRRSVLAGLLFVSPLISTPPTVARVSFRTMSFRTIAQSGAL